MSDRFSMQGKNAIITGGTRGIGLAIARGFVEAGATVTVCGRKPEGAESAAAELDAPDRVLAVAAHVGKSDDVDRLISQAEDRFGPVNVVVNNAGTNPYYGPIIDSEEWAFDKTMDVNLRAPYVLSLRLARKMVEGSGGSILHISSVAGLTASKNQGIYSVSKAALIMLTKVMAREMGRGGVRVNCILPGLIKTQLSRELWENPERAKAAAERKALGRLGETDELVGAAVYFCSEAGSFTTGAVLQVDGGLVI